MPLSEIQIEILRLLKDDQIRIEDCEEDDEVRYQAIGHTPAGQSLLVAVFVDRADDEKEIIRIISAREAEQYEQRTYARQFEERN